MIRGFDALGLAHDKYPVKNVIQSVPTDWAIGTFDHPFGDVSKKVNKLIDSSYKLFRIQAWWPKTPAHEIAPLDHTKKQAKKWQKIALANTHCKIYLSHSCEYNESSKQKVIDRVKILQDLAPNCIPVDSRFKGALSGMAIPEHHGAVNVGPGEIASTDGTNLYDINAQKYQDDNQDALIVFTWGFRENLREIPDPGQKVPPINLRNATPSVAYNKGLVRLLSPKNGASSIKAPEFVKPYAEDDQEENPMTPDDPRENRPCVALKVNAPHLDIIASNGQKIGILKRFNPPLAGGLYRYYSGLPGAIGLYGWEIGEKARKVSGSEIVSLKAGNKIYTGINLAFRDGTYR